MTPERAQRMRMLVAPSIVLLALSLRIAAQAFATRHGAAPSAMPVVYVVPASAGFRALVGGLAPGDDLAGWHVESLTTRDRTDVVAVTRGDESADLVVARRGAMPWAPPRQTERYAIYYSSAHHAADGGARSEIDRVIEALAVRIAAHENDVPAPGEL